MRPKSARSSCPICEKVSEEQGEKHHTNKEKPKAKKNWPLDVSRKTQDELFLQTAVAEPKGGIRSPAAGLGSRVPPDVLPGMVRRADPVVSTAMVRAFDVPSGNVGLDDQVLDAHGYSSPDQCARREGRRRALDPFIHPPLNKPFLPPLPSCPFIPCCVKNVSGAPLPCFPTCLGSAVRQGRPQASGPCFDAGNLAHSS